MSIKTPRLIQDRCGVYYFRWIVPLPWRPAVGKTELRRSLGTKDARLARQSALLLSANLEGIMASKKMAKGPQEPELGELDPALKSFLEGKKEAYKVVARVYKDGRAEIEADTLEEAKEARAMIEAHAKARIAEAEARKASYGRQGMAGGAAEAEAMLPSSLSGTHLRAAADDYIQERTAALSEKGTMPKVRGALAAFIAFAGNMDVGMVKAPKVRTYKKSMLDSGKAGTTINDHMSILHGFFDWCIDNGVAHIKNPAKGLAIQGAHAKAEPYKPYDDQELERIFAPEPYLKRMKLPDFYWGPLIALWSGARAEEIASLELRHIRQDKGVWVIDIEKGKTESSVRMVPLHSKLIGLGLLDYCEAVRKAGYKRLFPHLVDGKNGFKKNMCRMFGVHLDSPEVVIVDPMKVFHSFRHTAITKLTSANVNDGLKKSIVGHDVESKDTAHDGYIHGQALTMANRRKAVEKLKFPTVDAGALKLPPDHFLPAIAKRLAEQAKGAEKKAKKGPPIKAVQAKPAKKKALAAG